MHSIREEKRDGSFGAIPVKKGPAVYDEDAIFIRAALGLSDSLNIISPFILSYETQNLPL